MRLLGREEQAEQERNKFEFGKEQAVGSIALQFGLEVRDGESLTSIIDRAKPFAAEDRRLELEAAQSQINLVNAQMADIESGKVTDINAAADAAIINPAILGNIKDFDVLTQVINKVSEKEATDVVPGLVNQAISNGDSLDDILADLASSGAVQNVPQAQSIARNLYANTSPAEAQSKIGDKSGSPLIDLLYGFSLTGAQGLTGLSEFTTGIGDPNADIFQDKF